MPDEVAEQTAPVITGAEEATIEAPAGVLETVVEPASVDSGAVAETPVTSVPDLQTDAGILAAIEQNPNLKGFLTKREADAANTARQRRDAELRRDQGSNERAQGYHSWIVSELAKGVSPEDLARQTPSWIKANEDFTRTELMRSLLRQAGEFDETAKGLADTLEGTPDELTKVAQVTLDSAIKRARTEERAAAVAERDAYWQAKAEADIRAAQVEERLAGVSNPPNVQGSPTQLQAPVNPSTLPIDEYGALSSTQREAMWAAWQAHTEHQSRVA